MTQQTAPTGSTAPEATLDEAVSAFSALLSQEEPKPVETPAPRAKPPEETEPEAEEPAEEPTPEAAPATEEGTEEEPAPGEEEPASEEEPALPVEQPPIEVTLPGGEKVKVSLEELRAGYSRTQDYTQKTQQIAERRKQLERDAATVLDQSLTYRERLATVEEALTTLNAEPDWDRIRNDAPERYSEVHKQWSDTRARIDKVRQEREAVEGRIHAQSADLAEKAMAQEHARLLAKIPDFGDASKGPALRKDLVEYARTRGFSAEELANVTDHRALVLLHDAMQGERRARTTPKPVIEKKITRPTTSTIVTPGPVTPAPRRQITDLTKARQALAKSGRTDDAAKVFLEMEKLGG